MNQPLITTMEIHDTTIVPDVAVVNYVRVMENEPIEKGENFTYKAYWLLPNVLAVHVGKKSIYINLKEIKNAN